MKIILILILFVNQAASAASTCDNIKSDIVDVGDRIANFKGENIDSKTTYRELATQYDKALAEELLYSGLKEMLATYKKSSEDLALKNAKNYDGEFKKLSEEGINVRRRLLVLKELVDYSVNADTPEKFIKAQQEKKCGKVEDAQKNGISPNCFQMYKALRPMIEGYFAAKSKIPDPDKAESLEQFNKMVGELKSDVLKKQLSKLEETEKAILEAGLSCKSSEYKKCDGIELAVKQQQEFFADQDGSKLVDDIKDLKERHERLKTLHKIYTEDPTENLEKEFENFKAQVAITFNSKTKEFINPNSDKSENAQAVLKSYCKVDDGMKDLSTFKQCLENINENINKDDLDKKIAESRKNKIEASDKIKTFLATKELKNLMDVQKLLYERFKGSELNCLKNTPPNGEIFNVGCGIEPFNNPLSGQLSFFYESVSGITLYLQNGVKPSDEPNAGKSAQETLQTSCDKKLIVLKSCNIQTAEQKIQQQKAEEFHEKYIIEKSSRRNGADRIVKRRSTSSMVGQAVMTSLSAPDTMPFFMNAMSFNSQVDMMTQQAQWQKQYNYNMEQWNKIYMGNVYGGLNNYSSLYDPTIGGQSAADFGFNFTQS